MVEENLSPFFKKLQCQPPLLATNGETEELYKDNSKEELASSSDIDFVLSIINGITSENPKDVEEARSKAQTLIDSDKALNNSEGSGDYPKPKGEARSITKTDCESDSHSKVSNSEVEISEDDFWKDLNPEEIQTRKGNWQERKVQSDILRQHGNVSCIKNDFDEAVRCYSEAIDLIRDSACLYCNRAAAFIKLRKYEAAVEDCNRAIFICKSSLKARLYKAKALHLSKEYSRCLATLQEARQSLPNFLAVINDCQMKLFGPENSGEKAKDLGDVYPTEKFLRLAAKYDVSKMTTFFHESPFVKNKKC